MRPSACSTRPALTCVIALIWASASAAQVDPTPPRIDPAASAPAAPRSVVKASEQPPAPPPRAVPGAPANEPAVQRNVVEDDNARIEELNVRGAVRSISVKPKGPISAEYEVLPTDASRDPSEGPGSTKGAQGRRVWRVLNF